MCWAAAPNHVGKPKEQSDDHLWLYVGREVMGQPLFVIV